MKSLKITDNTKTATKSSNATKLKTKAQSSFFVTSSIKIHAQNAPLSVFPDS
jgi:hypothetical protein